MKERKFVGKMEIAGMTQDITRRNLGWRVACYYNVADDRFYSVQLMDRNSWFDPETLNENEIALYFLGDWTMKEVVAYTKKRIKECGFNPDFIGKDDD